MLHLKVFTDRLTRQQKDTMVLNTSCPELARLIFGEHITIETLADQNQLQAEYDAKGGGTQLQVKRGVNYGLPFNIHALVCAAVGIPMAANEEIRSVLLGPSGNRSVRPFPFLSLPSYCVLHLGKHPGKAVKGDGQAAAAGVSRCFQCHGSSSCSPEAG